MRCWPHLLLVIKKYARCGAGRIVVRGDYLPASLVVTKMPIWCGASRTDMFIFFYAQGKASHPQTDWIRRL
ncbi:hypothetical protein Hanom_Chr03g00272181 [Helianthus anomalus]